MEEKALLEAMMLDESDLAVLAPDLAKIASMIERAAGAIAGSDTVPAKPDVGWLRIVPENDPAVKTSDSAVAARHEIKDSGITVRDGVLTVPRVIG